MVVRRNAPKISGWHRWLGVLCLLVLLNGCGDSSTNVVTTGNDIQPGNRTGTIIIDSIPGRSSSSSLAQSSSLPEVDYIQLTIYQNIQQSSSPTSLVPLLLLGEIGRVDPQRRRATFRNIPTDMDLELIVHLLASPEATDEERSQLVALLRGSTRLSEGATQELDLIEDFEEFDPFTMATSLSVTPASTTIAEGMTQQFSATGALFDISTFDLSTNVVWSSSNLAVATIDNQGVARAGESGVTTITARYENLSTSATLTVLPRPTNNFTLSTSGTFDTDSGTFEGSPVPGWNADTHQLLVNAFEIPGGRTLSVTGAFPFSLTAQGNVTLDGTLQFNGLSAIDPGPGTDAGEVKIVAFGAINGTNGTIFARGGNATTGQDGGDGSRVALQAGGDINIHTINVDGGTTEDNGTAGGGRGGQITILAGGRHRANTLSANGGKGGSLDFAGKDGGGAGGSISVTADGNTGVTNASAAGGAGGFDVTGGPGGGGGTINFSIFGFLTVTNATAVGGSGGTGYLTGGDGGHGGIVALTSSLGSISASTILAQGGPGGTGDNFGGGNGGDGGSLTFGTAPVGTLVASVMGGIGGAGTPPGTAGTNGTITP